MSTHSCSRLSLSIVGSIAIALWYFSIAFSFSRLQVRGDSHPHGADPCAYHALELTPFVRLRVSSLFFDKSAKIHSIISTIAT